VRDETPNGSGEVFWWLGEAFAGRGDQQSALESYTRAAIELPLAKSKSLHASVLNAVGASLVRLGDLASRRGDIATAQSTYRKAVEILNPVTPSQYRNVPAIYIVADAYAGLAAGSTALAEHTRDGVERGRLWGEARSAYASSLAAWHQIPDPRRIGPSGFAAGDPLAVQRRLDEVTRLSGSAQH
jgi:tetratricopeptide (TPR) repeat protein